MRFYDARVKAMIETYAKIAELDLPDCTDYASLRKFSKRCPNPLDTAYVLNGGLWFPYPTLPPFSFLMPPSLPHFATQFAAVVGIDIASEPEPEPAPPPPEPLFEVNMMEPLIGWRRWLFVEHTGLLHAINLDIPWPPDTPMIAECFQAQRHNPKGEIVQEDCSCGIYAVDSEQSAPRIPHTAIVTGEVYGWGRYVRGDEGWRAQFAYPKAFYLTRQQNGGLAVALKKYHVPIYLDVPMQMYDPQEEGYEYGHGENTTHGDCRAADDSGAEEDPDTGYAAG